MIRKFLLVILAVWVSGPPLLLQDAHAAATSTMKTLSGGGHIDEIDISNRIIIIDDGVLLLSPATRVIDAMGRPSTIRALRRGAMVNYSATPDSNAAAKPEITEIVILPPGQKPKQDDD